MNPLPFPSHDLQSLLADMLEHLSSRDPGATSRLSSVISTAFYQYESNMRDGTPYTRPVISDDDAALLESGYFSLRDAAKFSEPRKAIEDSLRATGRWCPFCGLSRAATFDHYAPKKGGSPSYPEHSFNLWNLIPMCGRCNQRKASLTADHPRHIRFPHLYFDAGRISRTRLIADVVTEDAHPYLAFRVQFESEVGQDWMDVIDQACSRLQLFDEWSWQGQLEMSTVAMDYDPVTYPGGIAAILAHLEQRAESTRTLLGSNCLRAVVYEALARSREFWQGPYLAARGHGG